MEEPSPAADPIKRVISEKYDETGLTVGASLTVDAPIAKVESQVRILPFPYPAASARITPAPELAAIEKEKYESVLEHLKAITELPTSSAKKNKDVTTAPLSELEQYFLSKECILRYLRATKWKVEDAKKRLEDTIIWRREFGTETLNPDDFDREVPHPPRRY